MAAPAMVATMDVKGRTVSGEKYPRMRIDANMAELSPTKEGDEKEDVIAHDRGFGSARGTGRWTANATAIAIWPSAR